MQTYLNTKADHFGLLDNSGPFQVELIYSSIFAIIILLNTKHKKKTCTLTLKVVKKTVTNTLHGTNFSSVYGRNRLEKL